MDITLVVPVRDERATVAVLVASIEGQSRPPEAVVFVDGGSVDGTPGLLRDACSAHPTWRVVEAGAATPGVGRNVGFEAAETEWVALTDAGIRLDAHWLGRLARLTESEPDLDVVYGHYEPAVNGPFSELAALAYVAAPDRTDCGPVRSHSIASTLIRRDVWRRAGGFPDLRAAEDLLFMRQVDQMGARAAVAPEARVMWQLQDGFRSTFRRFRVYSRVNAEVGEQRNWHHGIARMYLLAIALAALPVPRRYRAALGVAAGLARAERGIWARREGRGAAWALNPVRVLGVSVVLLVVDAATFAGWTDAVLGRRRAN